MSNVTDLILKLIAIAMLWKSINWFKEFDKSRQKYS